MLWAMNGNTNNLIFWFLSYIYSTPSLLASLRNEIDPHVHLSASAAAPISSFTWEPLVNSSPLLKGAYFETFRLAHEPMSIRYLAAPVTLTDPTTAQPTSLAAGTFLTVPHNILQRDAALFPDPGTFQPERFIETSTDEASGVVGRVARYGEFLKPWGDGQGMCRGRVFAEREVLTIVACVIKAWDVSPAEKNGTWKLPGKKTGTGVCLPDRDMRVRVRRRVMAGV
jgi:cytochrome P450